MRKIKSHLGPRVYLELAKSGIVLLVVISASAGYLIAFPLEKHFSLWHCLSTLLGILCLSAGSSALNQIQDSKMDSKMRRTETRPLPSGRMSFTQALSFTLVCFAVGLCLLAWTNLKVLFLGLLAVFFYNVLYTLWWKRRLPYAAIPGAIPGALPILMGAVSSTDSLATPVGWYLFALLIYWQMPHFWVLAIRFKEDYSAGGVPTLPVERGTGHTLGEITIWTLGYIGLTFLGLFFLPVRWIYFAGAVGSSVWILLGLQSYLKKHDSNPKSWLPFFLRITFSLVLYLFFAVIDAWSIYFHLVETT